MTLPILSRDSSTTSIWSVSAEMKYDSDSDDERVFSDEQAMNEMYRKKIELWRKLRKIPNSIEINN
jgi:hypothetical protein